jgi:hypothetical protein
VGAGACASCGWGRAVLEAMQHCDGTAEWMHLLAALCMVI